MQIIKEVEELTPWSKETEYIIDGYQREHLRDLLQRKDTSSFMSTVIGALADRGYVIVKVMDR